MLIRRLVRKAVLAAPGVGSIAAQRDALLGERDQLIIERRRFSEERDLFLEQRNDLDASLRRVAGALETVMAQRDELFVVRDSLTGERDGLRLQRDALTGERDAGRAEVRRLTALLNPRAYLANEYLSGSGIEIGALHRPTPVPEGVEVRYVDRMTVAELKRHYPHLAPLDLGEPDIVDDGETLASIERESLDFVIANHFLEHCEDPIGTLRTFTDRLCPGGVMYLAVPDKHHTFDRARSVTPMAHLLRDHEEGPAWSRREHFLDYAENVEQRGGEDVVARADELQDEDYSIHFHVFNATAVYDLLRLVRERYEPTLELIGALAWNDEVVAVARKGKEA